MNHPVVQIIAIVVAAFITGVGFAFGTVWANKSTWLHKAPGMAG